MNRLPLDAPAGTQVLVAWKHGDTFGGPRLDRTVTTSDPFTQSGSVWPTLVRLACDDHPFRIDQVYLDEPAPGTWAWACEMAIAGNVPVRPLGDGSYNRLIYTEGSDELSMQCCTHGTYIEESIGRFDVDATNWEIGK